MKRVFATVFGVLCLAAGANADQDYGRTGLYVGAGALAAIETFDGNGFSNGGGLDLRVGYRFAPHISLEGLFEYIDGLDATSGGVRLKTSGWMLGVGPKAFVSDGSVQPYLSVGVGLLNLEFEVKSASGSAVVKESDVVIRPAVGVRRRRRGSVGEAVLEDVDGIEEGKVLPVIVGIDQRSIVMINSFTAI